MDLRRFFAWAAARWKYLALAVLVLGFWATLLVLAPTTPFTNGDTVDYINHGAHRLSGYPLFLKLFGLRHILVWQTLLLAMALGYLCMEIVRQSGRLWMAVLVFGLIAANAYVVSFAYSIYSEAFFVPVVAALMGAMMRFSSKPGVAGAVAVGTLAGLACTIRPTGVALVAAGLMLVLLVRGLSLRRAATLFAALLAPMIILIGAEQIYNHALHGDQTTSLAGPHLMAKASMIDTPAFSSSLSGPQRVLEGWIENDFAPARAIVAESPNPAVRMRMVMAYESCAADNCGDAARRLTGLSKAEANHQSFLLALKRIARNPLGLARLDWQDYWCLWAVFHDPSLTPAFNTYVAAHRPFPFQYYLGNRLDFVPKSRIGAVGNFAMMVVGVALMAASLVGLWLALTGRRTSPQGAIAVIAASIVQFLLVMTCLTAPAVSRFVLGVWPAVAVALVYNAVVVWPMVRRAFSLAASRWRGAPHTIAAPV